MKYEESHVFSISQENMEVSFCDSDEKGSLYSHGLVKKIANVLLCFKKKLPRAVWIIIARAKSELLQTLSKSELL